jgi:hypothetical protein
VVENQEEKEEKEDHLEDQSKEINLLYIYGKIYRF